jgi:hypothetical protein
VEEKKEARCGRSGLLEFFELGHLAWRIDEREHLFHLS